MKTFLSLLFLSVANAVIGQQNSKVQPFLPEIFSSYSNVRDFTISSKEDEAYFTIQSHLGEFSVILRIELKNNEWTEPRIVNFSGRYVDLEPFLSPDGLRLYFASNRPVDMANGAAEDFDIWYVERAQKGGKWSSPINMGETVNSEHDEFYPSVSESNNLYFTCYKPNSKRMDDIYISKWDNNAYLPPAPMSDSINTQGSEFNAFISPDESFIIFSSWNRKDGVGGGDLYISYKNVNGTWGKAKNLGEEVNSKYVDYCPFVNIETGTLFFTSKRSEVKADESGFNNYREFMNEIQKYESGFSRIYKFSMKGKITNKK